MPDPAGGRRSGADGGGGAEGYQLRLHGVGRGGKKLREIVVEGLHQAALRAEVGGQVQGAQRHVAQPAQPHGTDEALHPRLAEEVDGLLGVADQEDGLAVTVEVRGQQLDQLILGRRGVLHLVDKQVLQAHAGGSAQIVERRVAAQRGAGLQPELGEVAGAAFGKDELQLDQRAAGHAEERLGDDPLLRRVGVGRQRRDAAQGFADGFIAAHLLEDTGECGALRLVDQESQRFDIQAFFGAELALFGQHQVRQRAPVIQMRGLFFRHHGAAGTERNR